MEVEVEVEVGVVELGKPTWVYGLAYCMEHNTNTRMSTREYW